MSITLLFTKQLNFILIKFLSFTSKKLLLLNKNLIASLLVTIYFSPVLYQFIIVLKERKNGNKRPLKKFFKFLKISAFILIVAVVGVLTLNHTNYLNYKRPMKFNQYDQITFDDFRGLSLFRKDLYGNSKFAFINTSIESTINENEVCIEALFHPSRSYVYNKKTFSEELLTHEKYHFKITELFVRKAKEEISKLSKKDKKLIQYCIQKAKKEAQNYQKAYDYDTFHSYVHKEQKRYQQEIDSLLLLLDQFKNPKIIFHEKK